MPREVLDWDFETFSLHDDGSIVLYEYLGDDSPEFVYIEGWLSPGLEIKPTLYRRTKDEEGRIVYRKAE